MSSADCSLKSLTSPASRELLQSHNSLTFKLLKTVADFSQALATLHDRFGHELQMLVETFRKRNGELRKERPTNCPNGLAQVWELFLQQVEVNSQQHGDISRDMSSQLGQGLIERVFHRKIQSKKVFAHKERIEAILVKSNELLGKCYQDYCQAYAMALTDPGQFMSEYIASHNVYVHQLQATNGMVHAYQTKTLPRLLEELEECHLDTSSSISNSLAHSSELITEKSNEQAAGYQNLTLACRQTNHRADLIQFVKVANSQVAQESAPPPPDHKADPLDAGGEPSAEEKLIRYHQFQGPNLSVGRGAYDPKNMQIVPTFKNEIAPDFSQPPEQQQRPKLEQDRTSLEEKIDKFEERIESVSKSLARAQESRLHNKTNELQEELCARKFDFYVAQLHLSAVRSQLQLFEYNFRPISAVGQSVVTQAQDLDADHHHHHHQQQHNELTSGGAQSRHSPQQSSLVAAAGAAAAAANLSRADGQPAGVGGGGVGVGGPQSSPGQTTQAPAYRHKWIKAFKSLKETPGAPSSSSSSSQQQQQQQQKFADMSMSDLSDQLAMTQQQAGSQPANQPENQHFFQEYTFKKIASCDVCKDFLRGHMRQGVKCKLCKISCHNDCQAKAHGTIKCQQPKIKLLRRQKSAGELELNANSDQDANESGETQRATSSKPDSIYSLIRQVLDAKKRGQTSAQHAHAADTSGDHHLRPAMFGASQAMNLSTGNLTLANQNGKSVSTSALLGATGSGGGGANTRPETSVDRWSVVMDLLAQSRKQKEGVGTAGDGNNNNNNGGKENKRHSKQLDKFKLAARSLGKHGQHYQTAMAAAAAAAATTTSAASASSSTSASSPTHTSNVGAAGGNSSSQQLAARQQRGEPATSSQLSAPAPSNPLLVHHTKSLPIGQMGFAQSDQQHQQQQYPNPSIGLISATPPIYSNDPTTQMGATPSRQYNQLLDLSLHQQQQQSTSAPHSPQRKRFNLRMKSFSLDSPESPVVVGVYGPSDVQQQQQQQQPAQHHHHHQHHHLQHYQQQQPPHSAHLYTQHQQASPFSSTEQMNVSMQQQQQQQQGRMAFSGADQTQAYFYYQQQQQQPITATSNYTDQQSTGGGLHAPRTTGGAGRHHQQHRHSYHNQTGGYHYASAAGAGADDSAPQLTGVDVGSVAQLYGGGGSLMAAASTFAMGRQCASQSALNIHHTSGSQQETSAQTNTSVCLSDSNKQQQQPTTTTTSTTAAGASVAQQRQQRHSFGSGGNLTNNNNNNNSSTSNSQKQEQEYYGELDVDHQQQQQQQHRHHHEQQQKQSATHRLQQQQQQQQQPGAHVQPLTNTLVVLYDYLAQRNDEIQLTAGQLAQLLDPSERDWWKVRSLDGTNRIGYFPSSYLAQLYPNERPLQVAQTIQVSNGETCDKLLRGQIVIHTGKQMDNFVTIRTIRPGASPGDTPQALVNYVDCPEKYLLEVIDTR